MLPAVYDRCLELQKIATFRPSRRQLTCNNRFNSQNASYSGSSSQSTSNADPTRTVFNPQRSPVTPSIYKPNTRPGIVGGEAKYWRWTPRFMKDFINWHKRIVYRHPERVMWFYGISGLLFMASPFIYGHIHAWLTLDGTQMKDHKTRTLYMARERAMTGNQIPLPFSKSVVHFNMGATALPPQILHEEAAERDKLADNKQNE